MVILAMALSNLGFALWCFSWPGLIKRIREFITFNAIRTGVLLFAACLCIWVGIFVVYDFPVTGDVTLFFQREGRAAMSGAIPTVDFHSSYMPLFTYVLGLADLLWPDNRAIPLLWTLLLATAGLVLRQVFIAGGEIPSLASALVVAGILNGAAWFLTIGCQQDEPLLVLFAALAMLFVLQEREIAGGAILALGLLTTKVLFLIPASVILIQSRKISRTLLGFVLCFVPIMSLFLSLGFDPFRMIGTEPQRFHPPSLTNLVAAIPFLYGSMKSSAWIGHFAAAIVWLFSLIYFLS